MTTKKPTKKEMFARILAKTTDVEERKFLEHEIELLENKGKSKEGKLSPEQEANEKLKKDILEGLDGSMTISAMIKNIPACEGLSTSKVSAVIRQMKLSGDVIREEIKGVAYFKKA
jgi:hypothetical protein